MSPPPKPPAAWFGPPLVALGAALWATDSVFRAAVAPRYSALFIVFLNHCLCLLPALPVLVSRRRTLRAFLPRDWLALAFISVLGSVVAMVFFTKAFATASNYSVPVLVQKLQPLFAIALARGLLKERVGRLFPLWAVLACGGAYLVSFGFGNAFDALQPKEATAVLYALLAAAIWGATTVAGRFLLGGRDFLFVTAARFTFGTVFIFLLCWLSGELAPLSSAIRDDLGDFLGMAFLSGLLPLLIYYLGLQSTPASLATLCELAFPLAAIVINWIFLQSPLTAGQLAGAAVLFAAITAMTIDRRSGQPPAVEA